MTPASLCAVRLTFEKLEPDAKGSCRNLTLELFKQCVSLIVLTRSRMAVETEYSLCVLLESAVQMVEFTTDLPRFLEHVRFRESPSACFRWLSGECALKPVGIAGTVSGEGPGGLGLAGVLRHVLGRVCAA